ncbi:MAG TPA: hypothetical protein VHO28_04765 [Ignavibacteriales bacterium]|nr:hypothetical protein [Ignavibacteriales bacterium]HEX3073033.1 hypothetical protein [Ignavibacteriales bacterium]
MKAALSLILCMLIISGCEDSSSETAGDSPSIRILKLEPSVGKVGDKFKLTYSFKNIETGRDGDLNFEQKVWSLYDSASGNVVYGFIPYAAGKTSLKVGVRGLYGDVFISDNTEIIYAEPNARGIRIMSSDEPSLTEKQAYYFQPAFLDDYKWHTEIKGDTVTLSRHYNDASYNIVFLNRKIKLPALIDFRVIYKCVDCGYANDTVHLKNGLIKIDQWQPGNLYSGVIYSDLKGQIEPDYIFPIVRFWGKL